MDGDGSDEVVRPRPGVARPEGLARLATAVARMPESVFAIVDGGHFDDLPSGLANAGLLARSLFLGHGDRDVERHGPWFVSLRHGRDADTVLNVVGDLPAVVFWSCPAGDVALYGHLRRLNQARIPTWAAAGKEAPEPGVKADWGYEAVLFRHWDPRVLGALLPVLDEGQFARVVGPAGEITFHTEDHGGTKRVVVNPEWPAAPAGMLTITGDQAVALVDRRLAAKRARIARYLQDVVSPELASAERTAIAQHVVHSEATARKTGIVTEAGQCRWTYLMYATRGQVAHRADILDQLRNSPRGPDAELSALMKEALRHLQMEHTQASQVAP